jgi:hypothetical protein
MDANSTPRAVIVDGRPRIFFFAIKDIAPGEEISYRYDKGVPPPPYPWRVQVNVKEGIA